MSHFSGEDETVGDRSWWPCHNPSLSPRVKPQPYFIQTSHDPRQRESHKREDGLRVGLSMERRQQKPGCCWVIWRQRWWIPWETVEDIHQGSHYALNKKRDYHMVRLCAGMMNKGILMRFGHSDKQAASVASGSKGINNPRLTGLWAEWPPSWGCCFRGETRRSQRHFEEERQAVARAVGTSTGATLEYNLEVHRSQELSQLIWHK